MSDANKRRTHQVFEKIYYGLYQRYQHLISDSQPQYKWEKDVEIIDSSTVSLFKDILQCVGRHPSNGRRKGGIKVHTPINLQEQVPKLVWFSSATTHDRQFFHHLNLQPGKIAVFDRGYNDYAMFDTFSSQKICWLLICPPERFDITLLAGKLSESKCAIYWLVKSLTRSNNTLRSLHLYVNSNFRVG